MTNVIRLLSFFQSRKIVEEFYDGVYLGSPRISVVVGDKTADAAKEGGDDKEGKEEAEGDSAAAIATLVIWRGRLAAASATAATAAAEEET